MPAPTNVPVTNPPDHFADIASALYRIADDIVTLTGSGLPQRSYIQLSIQPGTGDDDEARRAVDAVTSAILGHPGQVEVMGGGAYHYSNGDAAEPVGPVGVRVMRGVSAEWALKNDVAAAEAELAEREAEWKKARNKLIELRAARSSEPSTLKTDAAGLDFTRADTEDAPQAATVRGHHYGVQVTDNKFVIDPVDGNETR